MQVATHVNFSGEEELSMNAQFVLQLCRKLAQKFNNSKTALDNQQIKSVLMKHSDNNSLLLGLKFYYLFDTVHTPLQGVSKIIFIKIIFHTSD